jgi:hypothetical protein
MSAAARYERVGSEGYHSLFRWYSGFEAAQFPDPSGLRARLSAWTLGELSLLHVVLGRVASPVLDRLEHMSQALWQKTCCNAVRPGAYPAVVRAAMAAFDIVEAIAVARTATCSNRAPLTRIQVCAAPAFVQHCRCGVHAACPRRRSPRAMWSACYSTGVIYQYLSGVPAARQLSKNNQLVTEVVQGAYCAGAGVLRGHAVLLLGAGHARRRLAVRLLPVHLRQLVWGPLRRGALLCAACALLSHSIKASAAHGFLPQSCPPVFIFKPAFACDQIASLTRLQAFSSLRIPHYKGFSRIHINTKVLISRRPAGPWAPKRSLHVSSRQCRGLT